MLPDTTVTALMGKPPQRACSERKPLRPLALMLAGALNEACLYVADADDQVVARQEVEELITGLLSGLRTPASNADA